MKRNCPEAKCARRGSVGALAGFWKQKARLAPDSLPAMPGLTHDPSLRPWRAQQGR